MGPYFKRENMGETTGPSVYLTGLNSRSIHTIYAGSFVVSLAEGIRLISLLAFG